MKFVKYFLQKKSVTILLLVLVLAGGLFSYVKMGKLEDAPFTINGRCLHTVDFHLGYILYFQQFVLYQFGLVFQFPV